MPLYGDDGRLIISIQFNQDYMAWITQGPISDRSLERLGESDKGIIMYRRMLRQQMAILEDGGEPMNVFRDPALNVCIDLPWPALPPGNYRQKITIFGQTELEIRQDIPNSTSAKKLWLNQKKQQTRSLYTSLKSTSRVHSTTTGGKFHRCWANSSFNLFN